MRKEKRAAWGVPCVPEEELLLLAELAVVAFKRLLSLMHEVLKLLIFLE